MTAGVVRDLRYAVRSLLRRPIVVAGVVAAMATGLGANAAVATLTIAFLGAPPPGLHDAPSLARVHVRTATGERGGSGMLSRAEAEAIQRHAGGIGNLVAYSVRDVLLDSEQGVRTARVGFYVGDLRGVVSGIPRRHATAHVLARAPAGGIAAPGQSGIRVSGRWYPIDGTLPPAFAGFDLSSVDYWLPFPRDGASAADDDRSLRAIVRLAGAGGRERFAAVTERVLNDLPRPAGRAAARWGPVQVSVSKLVRADMEESPALRTLASALVIAGLLVLLAAVVNASQLLLTRVAERSTELAIRSALGARHVDLLRVLGVEVLVLCGLASLVAFAVLALFTAWFRAFLDLGTPVGGAGRLGAVVSGLALTLLCAFVMSAIASRSLGPHLSDSLRAGAGATPRQRRWRQASLAAQSTLAGVVVMLAMLLVSVAQHATRADFGLDVDGTLVVRASFPSDDPGVVGDGYRRMASAIEKMPGIIGVSVSSSIPLRSSVATYIELPGRDRPPMLPTGGPYLTEVDAAFLRATGARLTRGRFFERAEDRGTTIVVNETAAHLYWPGVDPVGECARIGPGAGCARVIGVLANIRRESLIEGATAQIYRLQEDHSPFVPLALLVRGSPGIGQLSSGIQAALSRGAPDVRAQVSMLNEMTQRERQVWTMLASLAGAIALIGVLTAGAGILSMAAYQAAARRRDFAIRMALGSSTARVVGGAAAQSTVIVSLGLSAGAVLVALLAPRVVPRSADMGILDWPQALIILVGVLLGSLAAATYPVITGARVDLRSALGEP